MSTNAFDQLARDENRGAEQWEMEREESKDARIAELEFVVKIFSDRLRDYERRELQRLPPHEAREFYLAEFKGEMAKKDGRIAELEAEYAHLDEVASKTIGLLTAERDQLRQQLDEIRPLKAVRKGRTKC